MGSVDHRDMGPGQAHCFEFAFDGIGHQTPRRFPLNPRFRREVMLRETSVAMSELKLIRQVVDGTAGP